MAVNNLFGTKWLVNEDIVFPPISGGYLLTVDVNIHVESAGDFRHLMFNTEGGNIIEVFDDDYVLSEVLYNGPAGEDWLSDEYRFWSFVGGSPSDSGYSDSVLISWLEENATQIIDPPTTEPFLSKTGLSKVWQNILSYLNGKQATLVSGTNIKTVNNQSLLGSGNLDIGGGTVDTAMSDTSENAVQNKVIKSYVDGKTGDLSTLGTTAKTNLVSAVNEVNGKAGFHVAVNQERWVGTYTDENNVTYQVYSKQVYIPALPATAGITTYEHGISNIKQILDIYGSTTDGFVLNAPRQTVTDNITIYQASKSASNRTFSIEVGKDRSSKKAYVTVVYAKNN